MSRENRITFDPFCLDLANQCLWRGAQAIKLRPKAFAVLDYLVGRPGRLVTKEELLQPVWSETFVGDAVLKVAIRQLREALGDDPKVPRSIETAHRRGYRFVAQITENPQVPAAGQQVMSKSAAASWPRRATGPLLSVVGRDGAMARMHGWLEKMIGGKRQIVFVTGEAGIGKTVLIDTFARSISFDRGMRVVRGQCLEQYGTGEAYLPFLEAIG